MKKLMEEFNRFIKAQEDTTPLMIEMHPELQEISTWIDVHNAYTKYKRLYVSEKLAVKKLDSEILRLKKHLRHHDYNVQRKLMHRFFGHTKNKLTF